MKHLLYIPFNNNKKSRLLQFFFNTLPELYRLFPGLENCWANFKTFSTIQDSVRTLGSMNIVYISLATHLFILVSQQIPFIRNLCLPSLPEFQKHGRCGKDHRSYFWKIKQTNKVAIRTLELAEAQ